MADAIAFDASANASFAANINASDSGSGHNIKEGSNCRMGLATLALGTVMVANNSVTSNTRIFHSRQMTGGVVGNLSITKVAGTSFTITSSSLLETSTVAWELKEPC